VLNVLLVALGSAGDVHPFIALGRALKSRGHRATLVSIGVFEQTAQDAGLHFIEVLDPEQYEAVSNNPDVWDPVKGIKLIIEKFYVPAMPEVYRIIEENADTDTMVVASSLCIGARIAQEKLNIPLVTIHLQPFVFISRINPPVLPVGNFPRWLPQPLNTAMWSTLEWIFDRAFGREIKTYRAELGLQTTRGIFTRWLNSPQRIIGLFPEWYGPPAPDWPEQTHLTGFVRFDGAEFEELPESVEDFLRSGEPPVVFTPGTAMQHGKDFFSAGIEACRSMGKRAVLLTLHTEHLPSELPEDIVHFEYVPFSQILNRSAALVHHGGIGTTAQGLSAAIPQLVMPMNFDQPDNAARMENLNIGASLRPSEWTGTNVASKLEHLLSSVEVAEQCQTLSRRIDFDEALEQTCRVIEEMV